MIHFFATFTKDARESEFGLALKRVGVEHIIFSDKLDFTYKSRLKHLCINLPNLALFALRKSFSSLTSQITPKYIVLGSDIEVIIYTLVRAILRKNTKIVMASFIFTQRDSTFENAIRRFYYAQVLAQTELIVVHSSLEVERYSSIFPKARNKFLFIPWVGHVAQRSRLIKISKQTLNHSFTLVSAGRSGRDYYTLYKAIHDIDVELKIICDSLKPPPINPARAKITSLNSCYGFDFLEHLAKADIVVIPLAVHNISAGQMVLIQAMALGKAIVVTDTPTIRDYATDRHDVWLVKPQDATAMQEAIQTLMADKSLREKLGHNASETYDRNHANDAYLRTLINNLT